MVSQEDSNSDEIRKNGSTPSTGDASTDQEDMEKQDDDFVKVDLDSGSQEQPLEQPVHSPCAGSARNKLIICAALSILIIGILIGVFVGMKNKSTEENLKPPVVATSSPGTTTSLPGATTPSNPPVATHPVAAPSEPPVKDPTASPTSIPTATPTSAPTMDFRAPIVEFLKEKGIVIDLEGSEPSGKALEWLVDDAVVSNAIVGNELNLNDKLIQRFAVVAIGYGLLGETGNSSISMSFNVDECLWPHVVCVDDVVTELSFGSQGFEGRLVSEIGLLKNLTTFDAAKNQLQGTLPDQLYALSNLEHLYLYKNQLSGPISDKAGNWWRLATLHLSHNQLTGTIPQSMQSGTNTMRAFYYMNLKNNRLTGTIPENLRWRNLWYLDLGRNQFTGTLPSDLGEKFVRLGHLFLDHNQFNGTFPDSYLNAGNGRLEQLAIDHNQLTGQVPGDYKNINIMVAFTMDGNQFQRLGDKTCQISVFDSGECVEFRADCDICKCKSLCQGC